MKSRPLLGSNFQKQMTNKELFDISHEISRNYAPAILKETPKFDDNLVLSKDELLEVSHNISLYFAPRILPNSENLVLLPIDPQHIYVYWNLGDRQSSQPFQDMLDQELRLSVFSHDKGGEARIKKIYETTVHGIQSGEEIKLPVPQKTGIYSASMSQYLPENPRVTLVDSNLVHTSYRGIEQNENINENLIESPIKFNFSVDVSSFDENTVVVAKSHIAKSNYSGQRNITN